MFNYQVYNVSNLLRYDNKISDITGLYHLSLEIDFFRLLHLRKVDINPPLLDRQHKEFITDQFIPDQILP